MQHEMGFFFQGIFIFQAIFLLIMSPNNKTRDASTVLQYIRTDKHIQNLLWKVGASVHGCMGQGVESRGNLNGSQEVLIVYPVHLSWKCDTAIDNANFMRKLISLTGKIVPFDRKNTVHTHRIGWVLITRGGTHSLTGSTPSVTGQNNYCASKNKYFCDKAKWKIIPVTESILHVTLTVPLVKGGKFPVTWWNMSMSQEKLPLTGRIPHVTKRV